MTLSQFSARFAAVSCGPCSSDRCVLFGTHGTLWLCSRLPRPASAASTCHRRAQRRSRILDQNQSSASSNRKRKVSGCTAYHVYLRVRRARSRTVMLQLPSSENSDYRISCGPQTTVDSDHRDDVVGRVAARALTLSMRTPSSSDGGRPRPRRAQIAPAKFPTDCEIAVSI